MKNKIWTIYLHKNKTTGKCYVGQTCKKLESRWGKDGSNYTKNNNLKFYNAIQKYGWNDFEHYILATCNNLEEAYELEQYYINEFDTYKNGYNSTMGGAGSKGKVLSLEAKERISKSHKGKPTWLSYLPKEKRPFYGKHHTEETKKKIGNANRGRVISQEGRERMRLAKLGKKGQKRTEKTKTKLRNQKLGNKNPMYGKHTNNRPNSTIPVVQIDLNGNIVAEYESIGEAMRKTGFWGIGRAIKRNIKAGNYIWKKKN